MERRNRPSRWPSRSRANIPAWRLSCRNKTLFMNSSNFMRRRLSPLSAELLLLACLSAGCVATAGAEAGFDRPSEQRVRARDLGLILGQYQSGPLNAITDVAGVKV